MQFQKREYYVSFNSFPTFLFRRQIAYLAADIKCIKSTARLLDINFVNKRGLDISKEVLWVSVCRRAAKLPAGKVGGLKKNSATYPVQESQV